MGRKKKKPEKEPNHERWLVSYADFITLLFAVFVTLYAMSQVDKQKVDQVINSLKGSFGISPLPSVPTGSVIGPVIPMLVMPPSQFGTESVPFHARRPEDLLTLKTELQQFLEVQDLQEISLELDRRGLIISLEATSFFDSGSAKVRAEAFPALDQLAAALKRYTNLIQIEGFTDNTPIHTAQFPSNWELSTARATAILHYLIEYGGISPTRLSAAGFGEYRPRGDNSTEEGRRENRRVDIVLMTGREENILP